MVVMLNDEWTSTIRQKELLNNTLCKYKSHNGKFNASFQHSVSGDRNTIIQLKGHSQENEQKNTSQSETNKEIEEIESINTINDNKNILIEDVDMNESMGNNDRDFIVITKQTTYIAVAPLEKIKGKHPREKIINIGIIFAKTAGYTGASTRTINKKKYIAIFFDNQTDLNLAIGTPIQISENESYQFVEINTIRIKPTNEQINEINACTIQVCDIPLDIKTPIIRSTFSRFGTIVKLSVQTRGLYQHAFITFAESQNIQEFHTKTWSVYILKDSTRVIPLTLDEEQRNNRRIYSIKLSGFPAGTSARDLHDI
ncbi:8983_t:CDS:2, partial [Entrophospora sp. SA101]